jgi:antitoxin (DNA-binding transcriptional repressor) of toxin-antitoxin stability system
MRFLRGSLGRVLSGKPLRPGSRRLTARGWAAAAGGAVVVTLIGVVVASIVPGPRAGAAASGLRSSGRARTGSGRAGTRAIPAATATRTGRPPATRPPQKRIAAGQAGSVLRTSCRRVAHIGDSTSVDLISSADLPDPAERLPARYADVGVRHLLMDASGGRSIVEALPRQVNGYNVAQAWWNQGYRGCWVFALGTNDAANVSVGSAVGLTGRINELMSVAHGEPVLWVNTVTELSSGPWSDANEQLWDAALLSALARYPNMRILNWAAVAQPGWFLPDGIHYNPVGCAARAQAIAEGLARAFPASGGSQGQIVL